MMTKPILNIVGVSVIRVLGRIDSWYRFSLTIIWRGRQHCGTMFQNNFTQIVNNDKNQIAERILRLLLNDGL